MKKEIRITFLLNVINYLNNIGIITYFSMYQNININHNIYALKLGVVLSLWLLSPVLLLFVTIFPLLNNEKLYCENLKIELILNFSFKVIAYIVLLSYTKTIFFSDIYKFKIIIELIFMVCTLIIDFKIYLKIKSLEGNTLNLLEESITHIEKRNIYNIKKASYVANTSIFSFVIFGLSLVLFSFQEMNWQIDIIATIISSISFVKFIHDIHEKCVLIYLDENKKRENFIKEIIYATISYSICISVSMNLIRIDNEVFRFVIYLISILILYPIMQNNKKINLRYKKIKKSLIDELVVYYEE